MNANFEVILDDSINVSSLTKAGDFEGALSYVKENIDEVLHMYPDQDGPFRWLAHIYQKLSLTISILFWIIPIIHLYLVADYNHFIQKLEFWGIQYIYWALGFFTYLRNSHVPSSM